MVNLRELEPLGLGAPGIGPGGASLAANDILDLELEAIFVGGESADGSASRSFPDISRRVADELLLDQELDPPAAPRPDPQLAAEPFFLVSLPGSDRSAGRYRPPGRNAPPSAALPAAKASAASDAGVSLAELLDRARGLAAAAVSSEVRSHAALYDAIGCAYDLGLAADHAPDELAQLLLAANVAVHKRSPATAVVKLVFGGGYDKTRLAEFAAALSHGRRIGLERGALAPFLQSSGGGLKSVVAEERRLRRAETGETRPARTGPRPAIAARLRAMPARPLSAISGEGDEFLLVLVRRMPDGTAAMIGQVPRDIPLLERAALRLADGQD